MICKDLLTQVFPFVADPSSPRAYSTHTYTPKFLEIV